MPEPWEIMVSDAARRYYEALGRDLQDAVAAKIDRLEYWPEVSAQPIWGAGGGYYRMKARNIRIIFRVDRRENRIYVEVIDHRGRAYRDYHHYKKG